MVRNLNIEDCHESLRSGHGWLCYAVPFCVESLYAGVFDACGHLTYRTYFKWIPIEGKRQVNDLDDVNWDAPNRTLSAPLRETEEKKVSEYLH